MEKKILIVEDEYSINDVLTFTFKKEGYTVKNVFDGKCALDEIEAFKPDLILLDAMLPDIDGFEILKEIGKNQLVIMITARDSIFDKIVGIELGADDYITKPFEIREVIVRVKALFRTLNKEAVEVQNSRIQLTEDIEVNLQGGQVFKNQEEIKLKRREWELFEYLLNNRNRVFSREELLDNVWGYDYIGDSRTVDVHIRRIRSKLAIEKNSLIETVFGRGYVMR